MSVARRLAGLARNVGGDHEHDPCEGKENYWESGAGDCGAGRIFGFFRSGNRFGASAFLCLWWLRATVSGLCGAAVLLRTRAGLCWTGVRPVRILQTTPPPSRVSLLG